MVMIEFMYHFLGSNLMRMALILSIPYWLLLSLETRLPRSYSRISLFAIDFLILAAIHSTISALLFTYQIPSHPIIIKSMFSFFVLVMSGFGVIICYSGFSFTSLYSRSPNARERFKPPLTLPKFTLPPAFLILSSSIAS